MLELATTPSDPGRSAPVSGVPVSAANQAQITQAQSTQPQITQAQHTQAYSAPVAAPATASGMEGRGARKLSLPALEALAAALAQLRERSGGGRNESSPRLSAVLATSHRGPANP